MVTFAQAQERAEEWINGDVPGYQHREVRVREFELGFVVWAEDRADGPRSDGGAQRLVIARDSGEATLWPGLPVGEVIRRYEEEYGAPDGTPEPAPAPSARVDLNQTSFLLSPPEWLQEAADKLGIPDRRPGASGASGSDGAGSRPAAAAAAAAASGPGQGPASTGGGPVAPAPGEPEDAVPHGGPFGAGPRTAPGLPGTSGVSGVSGVSGGATPWPAAAAGDEPDAGPRDAVGPPRVPASATPWAGTDTNADAGEDRSVPLLGDGVRTAPDRCRRHRHTAARGDRGRQDGPDLRRQPASAHGGRPRARRPRASPAAVRLPPGSAGARHTSSGCAARLRVPAGARWCPGYPAASAARCLRSRRSAGHASRGRARVRLPAGARRRAELPQPPAGPGAPVAPPRPLPPNAGDIADAATSKAQPPRGARGGGPTAPPPPSAPGAPGARPGSAPAPSGPGAPGTPAGGYVPTQLVSQLGPDGPGGPAAPGVPGPPGAPAAPGTPGAPQPSGAPGTPQPPGGTPPGGVHHVATMLAGPPVGVPGAPQPPGVPGAPAAPGSQPPASTTPRRCWRARSPAAPAHRRPRRRPECRRAHRSRCPVSPCRVSPCRAGRWAARSRASRCLLANPCLQASSHRRTGTRRPVSRPSAPVTRPCCATARRTARSSS
ncbi:hypothetical protein ACFQ51_17670 [Streptomyces kaempferi]